MPNTSKHAHRQRHHNLNVYSISGAETNLENHASVICFGLADGPALVVSNKTEPVGPKLVHSKDKMDQIAALERGFIAAIKKLTAAHKKIEETEPQKANSLSAQIQLLQGRSLKEHMLDLVDKRKASATYAVEVVVEFLRKQYLEGNPIIQKYATDFAELGVHLRMGITGEKRVSLKSLKRPCIVVAENLTIEDIATADNKNILGWVLGSGANASHVKTFLRDSEVPVVSVADLSAIKTGDHILINALRERIAVKPTKKEIEEFVKERDSITGNDANIPLSEHAPVTRDGQAIQILGTLNLPKAVTAISNMRLPGIGLFRSECMFLGRTKEDWPNEDAQTKIIADVLKAMSPGFVTIRTADLGADKWEAGFGAIPGGDGSKLGVRAIRLCFEDPEFFHTHLRALIRAQAEVGNAYIMFPMINDLFEFRAAKGIALEMAHELKESGKINAIPHLHFGAMLETPAALIGTDKIAKEADFFSIGASDSIQYALAVDRDVKAVQHSYTPHHPAVLRLMKIGVDAANIAGKPISICGDMPSHRTYLPLVLGMGIRRITVATSSVGKLNAKLPVLDIPECEKLFKNVSDADTPDAAAEHVMEFHSNLK